MDDAALRRVIAWAAAQAGVAPLIAGLPDGVEASVRARGPHRVTVLINWANINQTVLLPVAEHDLLRGDNKDERHSVN